MPNESAAPPQRSPLFRRIFATTAFLAILPALATGLGAALLARGEANEDSVEVLRSAAELARVAIEPVLAARPALAGGDRKAVDTLAKELGRAGRFEVTVIDGAGRGIGDSTRDPEAIHGCNDDPEVSGARRTGFGHALRRVEPGGQRRLYVAIPAASPRSGWTTDPDTRSGARAVIRTSVAVDRLPLRFGSLYARIALFATPIALVVLLSAALAIRALVGAVREVTHAATAVAAGGEAPRGEARERDDELGDLARAVEAMGGELEARIETITRERNEIATIVAGLSEGLVATDRDGRIVLWNEAATRVLGIPVAPSLGARLIDVVPRAEPVSLVKEAAERREPRRAEVELLGGAAGRARVIDARATPVLGLDGDRARVVLVLRDVTDAHRYERLRRDFVANVSHELRTPLSLITGVAETLAEGALADPEKGPRFVGMLKRHVDGLARLVEDLLTLSALEATARPSPLAPVSVASAIERVLEPFEPALEARRIRLVRSVAPDLPPAAAHPEHVERAVRNLVENAAKYTSEGGTIEVRARAAGERIAIEVADTGCGIPPGDLERVFERFYRVEKSRSREAGGTGLGLAIVKHIMEQAQGCVSVASEPGKGSTFTLEFRRFPLSPPS